ncbi:type IV pilin accessory protein [Acinetobacter terrae]|uniref:Type IV pilin accessory protein n=2 Tax=Acinetobacter terrae TaxID=2731247 RepID=A0A4V2LQ02_9GAMM|nr:TfpX/TfpZ family type IV pilin accessory protein [Acinetobacter terrae]TCB60675.1 type IV pilin accessory protein [Acinetobacter terrae]
MIVSKRIRFFLRHLSCSMFIALLMIGLVFFVWYPVPLATAEGVTHIFLMLLTIDVMLGPLLTFLVYKEGKKTLKMDLSIIVFVQILAMSYGVYSIAQSRPVWIAQNGAIFQLVRANAVLPEDQAQAKLEYRKPGWGKLQWVAVDQTHPQYQRYTEHTLVPNLYTKLAAAESRIRQFSQPLENLKTFNNEQATEKQLKAYPEANAWMPLRTTGLGLVVLLNKQQGKVLGVVDLRPWQE